MKWIPYVVVAVLAVAVAAWVFWPSGDAAPGKDGAGAGASKPTPVATETRTEAEAMTRPGADPAAAGGERTVNPDRQPSTAEQALAERHARPMNKHFDQVSSWWKQAARYLEKENPALAQECAEIERTLREAARTGDASFDATALLNQEIAVAEKVKAAGSKNPDVAAMMDYIVESAKVALAGGDASSVPKPAVSGG